MISLHPLFSDGAVFQQKVYIPVWGRTEGNSKIKAEFSGVESCTKSTAEGKFILRLPPVTAGGPYTLRVTNLTTGEKITVKDILAGEVWVASGQSNMAYLLGNDGADNPGQLETRHIQSKEYCDTVKNPSRIRFTVVPKIATGLVEECVPGKWRYMNKENAPEASAVAAWFGKYVQEKNEVPIGLIISAYGGTSIESWTSRSGLLSNPDTADLVNFRDQLLCDAEVWDRKLESPEMDESAKDPGNRGVEWGWADPDFDDSGWAEMKIPGSWLKQKISGNGAVWVRKAIEIPASWLNKDLILNMDGIDKQDVTYFNGEKIGGMGEGMDYSFWDTPRIYQIPARLVKPGKNLIAVRAYSFIGDGAFGGKQSKYFLSPEGSDERVEIAGLWKAASELDLGVFHPAGIFPGPGNPDTPAILFDSMIRPLCPYAIRGVLWYQGENHTETLSDALSYEKKLSTMIHDWRYHWGQGNIPFILTQIANFSPERDPLFLSDSAWAVVRDAQRKICKTEPDVFMCSAIDLGDLDDIHPQDKKSVGQRMAASALYHIYNMNEVPPSGPVYETCQPENGAIRVKFSCADGLKLKEDRPQSFYIAGANRIFCPADSVRIEGSSLLISSENVSDPRAVRYAWTSGPESTLYNAAGLPASPFRTDDWELI